MSRISVVAGAVLAVWSATSVGAPALAAGRVALVIGNGIYQKAPALTNPPRDAADIAAALDRLGFSVKRLTDASAADIRKGLIDFGRTAQGSEMAVVFYAGHGMEVGGENWLIPVDAELRSDTDVENEAISLRTVSLQVAKATQLGLVILDACRNNPFARAMQRSLRTRAVTHGLAPTEPTDNVLVAFAAKDGTLANDGDGPNSPFTTALLRNIETPGLEISFLFRNVRDEVMAATKREQQPFVYGSLSKEAIYLKAVEPSATTVTGVSAPDEMVWKTINDSVAPTVFEDFLRRFPASERVSDARSRLEKLRLASLGGTPSQPSRSTENPYFTEFYMNRVREIASRNRLVIPAFAIDAVDARVPAEFRRFVGVWASKVGYGGVGR